MTNITAGSPTPDINKLLALPLAVDHVSQQTASRLREVAQELLREAQNIVAKLSELADAFEGHGKLAADNAARFCDDAKHFMETAVRLHDRLNGKESVADSDFAEQPQPDSRARGYPPDAPQLEDRESDEVRFEGEVIFPTARMRGDEMNSREQDGRARGYLPNAPLLKGGGGAGR